MPASTPLLTLRITRAVAHPQAVGQARVFDEQGGTIGRAAGNDWILPDPSRVLSAHHATLYFEQDQYRLVDCSTNGVFVNDDPAALGAGRIATLRDGDRLQFGDYEVAVAIAAARAAMPAVEASRGVASQSVDPMQLLAAASAPPAVEPRAPVVTPAWFEAPPAAPALPSMQSAVVDPLLLLDGRSDVARPRGTDGVTARDDAPVLAAFFQPPTASAPLPVDWYATGVAIGALPVPPASACNVPPPSAAPAAAPAAMRDAEGDDVRVAVDAMLRAAGLDPARAPRVDPLGVLATAGSLLRESIGALRELLLALASVRNELGLPAKVMQAQGNNPLAFCPNGVEQVIDILLFEDGPACLGPVDAIRATLEELRTGRNQELAIVRRQVSDQLDRLAPAAIERACQASPRFRLLPGSTPAPATCWAMYGARHAEACAALAGSTHAPARRHAANPPVRLEEASHGLE